MLEREDALGGGPGVMRSRQGFLRSKPRWVFALVGAVSLCGCAAAGRTVRLAERKLPEPTSPGTFTVECDTPGNHFSAWTYGVRSGGAFLTGELRLFELRPTAEQVAAARVQLGGQGKSVAIRFVGREGPPVRLSVGLLEDTRSPRLTQLAVAEDYDPTLPIRFAIHWDGHHDATVIVGQKDLRRTVPISFSPEELSLSCSSAHAVFSNVVYESAPQAAAP
jgi:hypothetical protein